MTLVIRITLSILTVATMITFTADADAQIFRRVRDNIRANYSPQLPAGPVQVVPVQVVPVQVAPQPQRPGQLIRQPQRQYGQGLTPYSRLTPDQRGALTAAQQSGRINAANPNIQSDLVNVRVVTYFDPRSGRTFQRRFVSPVNGGAADRSGSQQQLAGSNPPVAGPTAPQRRVYDKIPKPAVVNPRQQLTAPPRQLTVQPNIRPSVNVVQQPQFNIPQIRVEPARVEQVPTRIQQTPVIAQQLPVLAGPQTIATNPVVAANPVVASPVYATPSIQSPTVQVEPAPSIAIAEEPTDAGDEIVIDPAVEPATATATSDAINIGSAGSVDAAKSAFSVLETPDDGANADSSDIIIDAATESSDFDIEINSADEVEAFFGE